MAAATRVLNLALQFILGPSVAGECLYRSNEEPDTRGMMMNESKQCVECAGDKGTQHWLASDGKVLRCRFALWYKVV